MHLLTRSAARRKDKAFGDNRLYAIAGITALGLLAGLVIGKVAYADELSHWDKNFIISAIETHNAQIIAGKIALQRTSDPEVESFARRMVDQQEKAIAALNRLAAQKNVDIPTRPDLIQRAKLDALSTFGGAVFDKHYVAMMGVSAQQDTVTLLQEADTHSEDMDVKLLATTMLPELELRLAMATSLKKKLDRAR